MGREIKQKDTKSSKHVETEKLHAFFRSIWDEQEDADGYCYCFETGKPMHGSKFRSNSACYDHILEKNRRAYPQYKYVKRNIRIIHPDTHHLKNQNINLTPKIKAYREYLLSLHEENKLKD